MIYICILLTILLIAVIGMSVYRNRKMEQEIMELTVYLERVQDRLELPEMKELTEGSLSILQSEIYKVVALLNQSYALEKKQKNYMADMLSDISHQMKTPLTAISLMTDLLAGPDLTEEDRMEYVSKIERQNQKILWLIRNLLTLSQLEAGRITLKQEEVNVENMLHQIKDTFEIMAELRMVDLFMEVDPNIVMKCDRRWTTEAISNVIKNCIEHTGAGKHVRVCVSQDNIATHIHIIDNGEGIAKEDVEHIFERFYKAKNAEKESVGIGLAMAKQIIMRQNGMISVTSEVGKGSDFYIKMYRMMI